MGPASRSRSQPRPESPLILVVEDQRPQQVLLTAALDARGYRTHLAGTGWEAMHLSQLVGPDLILVDLGLPDMDGVELCRHLRLMHHCPIIVVTADGQESRIIDVLDLGIDDYVVKPFSMSVLMARIRVAMRHHAAAAMVVDEELLQAGDVRVDVAAHQVLIGDDLVEFQARQFTMLAILVRNQGRVLTYSALSKALGGTEPTDEDRNSWRLLISKIRRQLGDGPSRPSIITELNVGYRLSAPDDGG